LGRRFVVAAYLLARFPPKSLGALHLGFFKKPHFDHFLKNLWGVSALFIVAKGVTAFITKERTTRLPGPEIKASWIR